MSTRTAPAVGPATRARGSKLRSRVAWALVLVVAVGLALALATRDTGSTVPLDPETPGPQGLRAVARVLDQEGVEVGIARDASAVATAVADRGEETTVVVTHPSRLVESTRTRLLEDAAGAHIILLAPHQDLFGNDLDVARASLHDIEGDCLDPRMDGLDLSSDTALLYAQRGCFGTDAGDVLVDLAPDVQAFGAPEAFSNDQVLRADNAAVALRLLGARQRVVFYSPSLDDMVATDTGTAASMLPRFLTPALVMIGLTMVGLMVWRGRRFGPLATEPLPVVVQATESTRARGRMQRRSADRAHVAGILRRSTRRRLADHLHVRPHDEIALVQAVAAHLELPPERASELTALLSDAAAPPTHDTDLNRLADSLAALEEEVRSR